MWQGSRPKPTLHLLPYAHISPHIRAMNENSEPKREPTAELATVAEVASVATQDPPTPGKVLPVADALERYLAAIRAIGLTAQIALPHIAKWTISEMEKTQKKIEKFVPDLPKRGEGPKTFTLESARDFAEFTSTIRQLDELRGQKSTAVLAKSLFTQLFAEFDAYIGELLKVIYLKNDKLLKGISREISLSDLLDYEDLNAVKLSMLDKEIETFRRDSYIEQFSTLEKKFNISLRKFSEWSEFVELSQRRNILTHNGGMVNDQYLVVCEREGYKFQSRPRIGDSTGVTFDYFTTASRLLSKVGLMLAYTLWSKVFPKESSDIHTALNGTIFHCLQQKRWRFVAELEDFVLSDPMRKGISEIDLRIRIVNASIGLKFSGRDSDAAKLLDSVDWSASYRDFRLATAVLHEKYLDATEIMRSIGKTGEIIRQSDYHTWPLFTRFRERPEFYEAYFDIYGEAFAEKVETAKGSVEAHAKSRHIHEPRRSEIGLVDVVERKPTTRKSVRRPASTAAEASPKPKSARRKRAGV
jgi:hypothetical protein